MDSMSEHTKHFERAAARYEPPDLSMDGLLNRRDRKRRNQRIAAGVVGIAVFVAAVWIVTNSPFDQTQTPAVPGGAETGPIETGPTETGPTYNGPTYTLGPVTNEDLAVGDAFMEAWVDGDGEAATAMFVPDATFDGFQPAIFPALYDWFRAGGWTFDSPRCGLHGRSLRRGVVGCGFTYENDLTRALDVGPVPTTLSFVIDDGRIETAWFGGGGDAIYNMFGSPGPIRNRPGGQNPDLFGPVWDMFIEWLSSHYPEDFGRMYDPDYGYPVPGYPILDPASIGLWERYTDEFVASPGALRRSFNEWMAGQSFEVQAGRICMTASGKFWAFWARVAGAGLPDEPPGRAYSAMADISEETLAELRALPLETEADRATMDAFVPLAERWIELFRGEGPPARAPAGSFFPDWFVELKDLESSMDTLIDGCLFPGLPG
jgi:hypothetical protein